MTLKERVIAAEHFIEDEASYLAHLIAAIGRARAGAGIQLALCIPLTILGLGALGIHATVSALGGSPRRRRRRGKG